MKQRNLDFLKHLGHQTAAAKLVFEKMPPQPFLLSENKDLPLHTVNMDGNKIEVSDMYWFLFSIKGVTDRTIENCITIARSKVFSAIDKM